MVPIHPLKRTSQHPRKLHGLRIKFPPPQCHWVASRGAFTLIELLAVMAILVLLASLLVPAVNSVSTGRALGGAIDRAWSAVSAARQEAIARQTPVALIFTTDRQASNTEKLDAFILVAAQSTTAADGSVTWKWIAAGAWRKLPRGVQLLPGDDGTGTPGFYSSGSLPPSYSQIAQSLPRLEGDTIASYSFGVFRPDGTVDTASSNPFLEFKRLRAGVSANDAALVLSPDSGRVRLVQYTKAP